MQDLDISQYDYPDLKPLDQDWRWVHQYAHDVLTGKIPSCKKVKWMAERHVRDMERDDLYFDIAAAKSIVAWFEYCPIVKGRLSGQPMVLDPTQIFIACSLIAWKWVEDKFEHNEEYDEEIQIQHAGARRYNQFYGQVSRKYGKTSFIAGLKLYLMYKYGYGPRVFSLATKKDQAKEVWSVAKKMINLSPRLKTIFHARANDILLPKTEGEFKALASDSNSLDGLDPIAACLDECHAIKDRNLYGVLISAFGSNEGGEFLFSIITTAGYILDGLCTDIYKNGTRVLDPSNDTTQDNYFYAIFEIDERDEWDDEANWYKSNPALIYGRPSLKYLRDRFQEASMSVAEKANFLTKHCNRFVSSADIWLDYDKFLACSAQLDFDDYKHRKCYIGFDRSQVSDITSAAVLFPDDDGGATVFVFNLQSEGAVKEAGDYLTGIYRNAEASGDLTIIKTNAIRNNDVINMIHPLWQQLPKCEAVFYDPYKMSECAHDLEAKGVVCVSVSQGPANLSEPTKKIEQMYLNGEFRYNSSVLLDYAASCAMIDASVFGNTKCYRDPGAVKTDKIDPLVATIIALSGATLQEIETNVYEERGMMSI
jgi:phage terminase large subunit-like protein